MKINKIDREFVEQYKLTINSQQINDFFKSNNPKDQIRNKLPARLDDFVRIILYFNFIDRKKNIFTKRELPLIEIPVYERHFWDNEKESLNKMLWALYRRDFELDFVQETAKKPNTQIQTKFFDDQREILLFSEGLDSVAAATEFEEATLVHVVKSRFTGSHIDKLNELFPGRKIEKITFIPSSGKISKLPPDTGISNSRGLIFLGLSSIHLHLNKSNTLISGENGLMMRNPPLFEGSKPTRTMNPEFVRSMQELLTHIYDEEIHIKTPYINKTKKEVLEIARGNLKEKFDFAIRESHSCFSQQPQGNKTKMCGRCYACILRTISIQALQGYDNSEYEGSPFSEEFKDGKGIVNVMDLMRFSKGVLQKKLPYAAKKIVDSDEDLFRRFAEEVVTTIRRIPEKSDYLIVESRRHFF
ncbi:MAG: 7-cyano-7-deazaguanine synthase [Methanoregula sp.]|jgi:7-cyano-7-deazaguanine synthase in queuosine biosynthesis|uniref:7-cyano-7-deazaguanine synthase n=1 Tax=Methanoregula sp. TaxID=2052170 RepID=UPI003D115E2E